MSELKDLRKSPLDGAEALCWATLYAGFAQAYKFPVEPPEGMSQAGYNVLKEQELLCATDHLMGELLVRMGEVSAEDFLKWSTP